MLAMAREDKESVAKRLKTNWHLYCTHMWLLMNSGFRR